MYQVVWNIGKRKCYLINFDWKCRFVVRAECLMPLSLSKVNKAFSADDIIDYEGRQPFDS